MNSAGYPKPDGLLLSTPVERLTDKSAALMEIEAKQKARAAKYAGLRHSRVQWIRRKERQS